MAFSKNRRLADLVSSAGEVSSFVDASVTHADLHTSMDLTGKTVTVANASTGDSDTTAANTAFVQQEIAALVDSAPGTLNTLNELAAALGDDASFSTTVTNSIALKAPLASPTFTGTVEIPNLTISSAQGTDGQVLTSTGSGINWEDAPAGYTDSDVETYLDGGTSTASFTNARFGGGILHSNANGGAIGLNRNPANGAYIGNSSLRRFQINGPDPTYGDVFDIQSYNSSGVFQGYVRIQDGNVTISDGNLTLGSTGATSASATPVEINLGGTFADSAGSAAKAKLKLYEHSTNIYGLGVSSGTFEYHNSYGAGKHDWYIGTDRKMRITHDGIIDLKTNNTGSIVVPNGTTAQQPTAATGMIRYNSTSSKLETYVGSAWENISTTAQSITGITGLDLWADVTGGISSTTIADLSGNSRTGTLSSTSHSGTLSGNTYMHFNGTSEYLSYGDGSNIPDYAGDVTFFFALTNTTGFSTYRTLIGDSSGAQGYQIIRTYGSTDDWNFYYKAGNQQVTSTNTVLNTNGSINSTQILIFSFASNGSGTIYKRTGGSEGSDTFAALSSFQKFMFASNTSSTFYIGNSSWAGEHYDGGIFAWGIIDHEITSTEKQVIYDYYATKNIGN